jgi:hypothetical protein
MGQRDPARQAGGNNAADLYGDLAGDRDLSDPTGLYDDLANGGPRRDPNQTRGTGGEGGEAAGEDGGPNIPQIPGIEGGTGATGFDEEYWRKVLSGGTGVDQRLGYGANYSGAGLDYNKDLEAYLLREGLPELDAQTLAAFQAAKEAQMGQADKAFTTERDALMEDMFGRGMQRSTVAGEAGGRALEGRARTMAGIEAQTMMAQLQQQNVLADRLQRGAATAGDIRSKFRQAQATENAAASQANATRAMAQAQMKSAEIAARSRMALGMAELDLKRELGLGDLAIKQGQLELGYDRLDYDYWAKEGDWANALEQIKMQQPSTFDKILGFAGAILPSVVPFIPGYKGG